MAKKFKVPAGYKLVKVETPTVKDAHIAKFKATMAEYGCKLLEERPNTYTRKNGNTSKGVLLSYQLPKGSTAQYQAGTARIWKVL